MVTPAFTVKDWLIKYILPVILVPIISSSIIAYGAVRSIETKQQSEEKRVDQIEKNLNMTRIDTSQLTTRVSKIETLMENFYKTIDRQTDLSDQYLAEIRKMRVELSEVKESMAVIKDREERRKK